MKEKNYTQRKYTKRKKEGSLIEFYYGYCLIKVLISTLTHPECGIDLVLFQLTCENILLYSILQYILNCVQARFNS